MIHRAILIVMDSAGVGHLPDADRFNDMGTNTLGHIYRQAGVLKIPNLCALGLGKIVEIGWTHPGVCGSYGKMAEQSVNKDTTSGHCEIAGIVLDSAFPTYPAETLLDVLHKNGYFTVGIGKIGDLFGHRGLSREIHTRNNEDGVDRTLDSIDDYRGKKGLIFVNLLVYGTNIKTDVNLGTRSTFADCGRTIADFLGAGKLNHGKSFKKDIVHD